MLTLEQAEVHCPDMIKNQKWRGTKEKYWFRCPIHGKYLRRFSNQYRGQRCMECSLISRSKNLRFSLKDWQEKHSTIDITDMRRKNGRTYLRISCSSKKSPGCVGSRWVAAVLVKGTKRACRACGKSKGGRIDEAGYRILSLKGHAIKEHRLVMSKILGRSLRKNEHVHHKNGVRSDNNPKNLVLKLAGHGSGQTLLERIEDIEHTCNIRIKHLIPAKFKKVWN